MGGDAGPGVITVGSFDFPESVLLAYLYAGALSARGYPVRVQPDLGSRELVEPALMTGLVQLVPEYTGSAGSAEKPPKRPERRRKSVPASRISRMPPEPRAAIVKDTPTVAEETRV